MTEKQWSCSLQNKKLSPELFRVVIAAGRKTLVELKKTNQVPTKMQRVVSKGGSRNLPDPLAKSLLAEIDSNEWFRSQVGERIEEGEGSAYKLAHLMVERPPGWTAEIEVLEAEADSQLQQREIEALTQQLEASQSKLEKTQSLANRLEREAKSVADNTEKKLRAHFQAKLDRSEENERQAHAELASQQEKNAKIQSQYEELTQLYQEAQHRLETFVEKERKRKGATTNQPANGEVGWSRVKPEMVARDLDRMYKTWVVQPRYRGSSIAEVTDEPLTLPETVTPTAIEAIDWIRTRPRSTKLVVDGHNVVWKLEPPAEGEMPSPMVRRRLESNLVQLRRVARGSLSVVVCWDSSRGDHGYRMSGLSVRFDQSADDAVVAEANTDQDVVVVSSDREVQERCRQLGAIPIFSEALVDWILTGFQ